MLNAAADNPRPATRHRVLSAPSAIHPPRQAIPTGGIQARATTQSNAGDPGRGEGPHPVNATKRRPIAGSAAAISSPIGVQLPRSRGDSRHESKATYHRAKRDAWASSSRRWAINRSIFARRRRFLNGWQPARVVG
jgi:hypothetical protein